LKIEKRTLTGKKFVKGKKKSMTDIRTIIHRLRLGQSKRNIHKELGIHRSIIRQLHSLAIIHQWLDPTLPMPSDEEVEKVWSKKTETKKHPLDPYKDQVEKWCKEGLSAVVIQRLLQEKCPCDVQVIRRYRAKNFPRTIEPVMVRSTIPGRDLELDFGELGRFLDENQQLRRVWLFSFRLRHSRKAYREIVLDQKLNTFLKGHIHAFEHFNGVPTNCIMDNLKSAVIRSTTDNDMIVRSYQELAEHYGFIISPCPPRTPEHKGGVEGDVKYVKRNFLPYFRARQEEKNIRIPKICDLIEALEKWDKEVADVHLIHGIKKSPLEIFQSEEEKALRPLPKERWELTTWYKSTVRRDWRIVVDSAFYSVPYQLIGKTVEVCITDSFVRIFHEGKQVTIHPRAKPQAYQRKAEHAPPFKEAVLQCSRDGLLAMAQDVGPFTYKMAQEIFANPTVDKLKPVRCLIRLAEKYGQQRLEKACQRAVNCSLFAYKSVKNILEKQLEYEEPKATPKIIPYTEFRFCRNSDDYKSQPGTFEEKFERIHPYSKHGNAMAGIRKSAEFDQAIDALLKDGVMPNNEFINQAWHVE
jgi:transposase